MTVNWICLDFGLFVHQNKQFWGYHLGLWKLKINFFLYSLTFYRENNRLIDNEKNCQLHFFFFSGFSIRSVMHPWPFVICVFCLWYNFSQITRPNKMNKKEDCYRSYVFAVFVLLILSLVLAVVLGDVHGASSQVRQQVLDQKGRFAGLLGHADIEVCWPVNWQTEDRRNLSFVSGNNVVICHFCMSLVKFLKKSISLYPSLPRWFMRSEGTICWNQELFDRTRKPYSIRVTWRRENSKTEKVTSAQLQKKKKHTKENWSLVRSLSRKAPEKPFALNIIQIM